MTGDDDDLATAKRKAEAARAKLTSTLVDLQARLNPKALMREAAHEVKEAAQELARDGLDTIKRHPITLAGATAAVGIFFARGPCGRSLMPIWMKPPRRPRV